MMSRVEIGDGTSIADSATVGVAYTADSRPPQIGADSTIRGGTVVYDDVVAGRDLQTGHHALIREETVLGDEVLVGTQAVIDGACDVGEGTGMQTGVYLPREAELGERVFLGPNATLLNDMYPVREEYSLAGPTIGDDASVGANATILPDVDVGPGAFVAAGAVVTDDVPPETLAVGNPAEHRELPTELEGGNDL
jgi:acetyltransferase-like isoleucine patch superfamily enzyme